MAYENLKNAIKQAIKQNGNQEITGPILQNTLLNIVNIIGADYKFLGFANPSTVPPADEGKLFYFASKSGEYTNFPTTGESTHIIIGESLYMFTKEANSNYWESEVLISVVQEFGDSTNKVVSQKLSTYGMSDYLTPLQNIILKSPTNIKATVTPETGYIALDGSIDSRSFLKIYSYKNNNKLVNAPEYVRVNIGINNLTSNQYAVAIYDLNNKLVKGFLNIAKNTDNIFLLPYKYTIKAIVYPKDIDNAIIEVSDSYEHVNYINKNDVVQEFGDSTNKVVSQKLSTYGMSDYLTPLQNIILKSPTNIKATVTPETGYIALDGSIDSRSFLKIYSYKNNNKLVNAPEYVRVNIGINNLTSNQYAVAIYDLNNKLVKGFLNIAKNTDNIFLLPYKYTIKAIVYPKDIDNAIIEVSDSYEHVNYINKNDVVQEFGDSTNKVVSQKLSTYGMSDYLTPLQNIILKSPTNIKATVTPETGYIALDGSIDSRSFLKIYSYKNNNKLVNAPEYVRVNIGINNLTSNQYAVAIYDSNNKLVKGFLNIGTNINNIFLLPAEFTIKVATFPKDTTCIIQAGDSIKKVEIPVLVQTWGDSITDADKYQDEIANVLGINRNNVKNFGISSDFSMHVANRFKSYFTERETDNVFIGNAIKRPNSISEVPSYNDRMKELNNSFFVIWIGTNNLLNYRRNRRSPEYTTQSLEFMKLCPQFNEKYDVLYSKSYISMIYDDIRTMVSLIPHSNFIIISGHASYTEEDKSQQDMIKLNNLLLKAYPRNYVDIETLLIINSEIEYSLTKSFVKPEINNTVLITLDSLKNLNSNSYLAIGTRDYYDLYKVVSLDSENVRISAKLVSSNTGLNTGDTVYDSYNLVSDLGRDSVTIKTKVYNYNDILRYNFNENPWSIGMDVHFTNEGYKLIGKLIADEILKIYNS